MVKIQRNNKQIKAFQLFNRSTLQLITACLPALLPSCLLIIFCIISLFFFLGHYSEILIDVGREVYYPEQILNGKVLYKDLFNIYGPLSYQINAILFKIIGVKLSTLYFAGSVCSVGIVLLIYLISRKFLSKFLSFSIGLFTISIGITTTSIFNFHFPYSWGMLYGLFAFLISLYFLIKLTSPKASFASGEGANLCISAFFAGISIACKYDFLLYSFIILFFIIKNKNWKAFLCLILAPVLSYGSLFLQGLHISDLINTSMIAKNIAKTNTLKFYYQNSGIYFHPKVILHDIISFLFVVIPFSGIIFGYDFFKKKNIFIKILSAILFCASSLFLFAILRIKANYIFDFILVFIFIFTVFAYKKLDFRQIIFSIVTISACAKVFWAVLIGNYGTFYLPFALICAFALVFKFLSKEFEKITAFIILFISLFFISNNINNINWQKIKTEKGEISTSIIRAENSKKLIEYINNNTDKNDKILILPEGMIINFLTSRKTDDFYNSLIPLYIETFGEEKIIKHYEMNKPQYIIFNNINMKDYYFKFICQDYALNFCEFVKENYNLVEIIDENSEKYDFIRYLIFKSK